jgi:ubiquinone/menaquinone biosynthesis C-methylase UbiE
MNILNWHIDNKVKNEAEEHYRTQFALSLKDESVLDIIRAITFDKVAPNIVFSDIQDLFKYVDDKFLDHALRGTGLEVGAGCGAFCSALATIPKVKKVYGVEFVESIVNTLMQKVVKETAQDQENKVIGCIGDFDNIQLPDQSVDFVFDFFSLHHSNNLQRTLKESYRVLKPGGFLLCFDKARPNSYAEQDLENLLNIKYDDHFKKQFNIPREKNLTRRMNGEHEFRLKDWKKLLSAAGFKDIKYYYLKKTLHNKFIIRFIKSFINILPIKIQLAITNFLNKINFDNKANFELQNVIYTSKINNFPKEISLIIAYKK